jgi:DNA-binding NarL/FixJ family response regulator
MKTTIVIADDHELVGKSISALLRDEPGFDVIGECNNGRDLLCMVERLRPNVAIVDVAMPEMNGLEAALRLRDIGGVTRVIMLTSYADEGYLQAALEARVAGYIVKSGAADDLIRAIHVGTRRNPYFSPEVAGIADRLRSGRPGFGRSAHSSSRKLSPREREVLQLIGEGNSMVEIAARLGISQSTVKDHRKHIKEKLGIHRTAELTRYAISIGMIRVEALEIQKSD